MTTTRRAPGRAALAAAVLLLTGLPTLRAQAQTGTISKRATTGATFLELGVGTRANGMGDAFVAIADDPSALYWNPAGIATQSRVNILLDHTEWLADTKFNFAGLTYGLGSGGTVGVSLTLFSVGDMLVRTLEDQEGSTGQQFSSSSYAIGLTYSRNLTDRFSLGLTPKYVHDQIWTVGAGAFAMDAGILYKTPFRGITLGAAITNYGTEMQLGGAELGSLLKDRPTSVSSPGVPVEVTTDSYPLPLTFRVGLAYKAFEANGQRLMLATDASVPSNDFQSVNVGAEYLVFNTVRFNAGYRAVGMSDSEGSFTAGVGLEQAFLGNIQARAGLSYAKFGRLQHTMKLNFALTL